VATKLDWLEIRWLAPSNRVDRLVDLPLGRYTTVTEGS